MWLLLLLLSGLGLASPRPSDSGSADLVLVAGDGEMSDLMKTAITMMEDRADRNLEQQVSIPFLSYYEHLIFKISIWF